MRLPAAAKSPAHAQAQDHVQHGHLRHHIPDCTREQIVKKKSAQLFRVRLKMTNDSLKEDEYTFCQAAHRRDTNTISGIPAEPK